jgi:hypothetical protein
MEVNKIKRKESKTNIQRLVYISHKVSGVTDRLQFIRIKCRGKKKGNEVHSMAHLELSFGRMCCGTGTV